MTTHTIPGELFLLLTDDAGRQDSTQFRRHALAAAAVAELALREKVALSEERAPRVSVTDPSPVDIPVLDQALGALAALDGKRVTAVISHRSMDLTEVIGEAFHAAGAVIRKEVWFTTAWPTHDDTLETALRARLAAAVQDPGTASLQDGILLELLRALKIAHRILKDDLPGIGRRDLDQRITSLQIDHPAARAVKRVVEDMSVVMMAATSG